VGGIDGINVVSGTGSITYGERAGNGVRVGGWGELFGDEGSAYWIAIKGLNAFSRMGDGRMPVGPLHETLRTHLALEADLDLVDVVLNRWQGERSEIAALSRVIAGAAEDGDESAARILSEAADELAGLVDTTRQLLNFGPDEDIPVSYSGGVFNARLVVEGFKATLERLHDGYELREPLSSPVVGAAIYAAKLAGEPLDVETIGRSGAAR
jgi:N-acetylglucosamine kinase-like BadF-type ATPase